jgi:hypothetical protein
MRNSFLTAFVLILMAACSEKGKQDQSAYALVPEDAAIIFQFNDHENFLKDLEDHKAIDQLKNLSAAKIIMKKLTPLDFVNNKYKALLILNAQTSKQLDFAYVAIDSLFSISVDSLNNKSVETLQQNGYEIQKVSVDSMAFFTRNIGGYPVISSSVEFIDKMEASYKKGGNRSLFRFTNVLDPSKAGHLMINSKHSDSLAQLLFKGAFRHPLSKFSDWWTMDLSLDNDALLLNGISVPLDTAGIFLRQFQNTKSLGQLFSFMPKETNSYNTYGLGNFHQFLKKEQVISADHPIIKDSIFNTTEEVGMAQTSNGAILYLRTYGATTILDYLKTGQITATEFQGSELLELKPNRALDSVFASFIIPLNLKYGSVIENTVVLTENENALKMALQTYRNGETFETSLLWQNTRDVLTEEATITKINDYEGFLGFLEEETNDILAQEYLTLDLKDHLFGAQLIAEDHFFHTQYFIKAIKTSPGNNSVQKLFSVSLDTELAIPPQFVLNHRTGKKEIVVQDRDHMLYLISTAGNILWKKQLSGPIQGKIHQVDLYKNNKLQLAFTTDSQFLILDRNGKTVSPFTLEFKGGNLNGLAVFDYEGNKNYRFLVTQDDKVYMYNNKAQIVKGFTYTKAEDQIMAPPQHFRMGNRDYLVFQLKNKKLKILNRTGQDRIRITEEIPFSQNTVKVYKNKFTLTTNDGLLVEIGTNGKVQQTNLNLHKEHGLDATSKTLVIMDDNILSIRDKKTALPLGVYSAPLIFYLNDKIYISVTDLQSQQTYLFDSQAQPISNFPIYGMSSIDMADMDNDRRPELVVKDQENTISVYKIN